MNDKMRPITTIIYYQNIPIYLAINNGLIKRDQQ